MVRIFFDPWIGKLYGKYLARYVKMDVGGGTKFLKYICLMMNKVLEN